MGTSWADMRFRIFHEMRARRPRTKAGTKNAAMRHLNEVPSGRCSTTTPSLPSRVHSHPNEARIWLSQDHFGVEAERLWSDVPGASVTLPD